MVYQLVRQLGPVFLGEKFHEIELDLPPGAVQLDIVEKKLIEETLKRTGGNVLKASRLLGIQRGALRYKLIKHGINPQSFAGRSKEPLEVY